MKLISLFGIAITGVFIVWFLLDLFCSAVTRIITRQHVLEKHTVIIQNALKSSMISQYTDPLQVTEFLMTGGLVSKFQALYDEGKTVKITAKDIAMYFGYRMKIRGITFRVSGHYVVLVLNCGSFVIFDESSENPNMA
jgi:hypothetical protein